MDRPWARTKLLEFHGLCRIFASTMRLGSLDGDASLHENIARRQPTVLAILAALDPALTEFDVATDPEDAARCAVMGIAILEDQEEVAERLRPDAPTLPADEFHPWVWEAARTFWEAGAYAVAVEQAAKSITAHAQRKTGCKLTDLDLMKQVWSGDGPQPGKPRLRLPGDRTTKTWESRQRGARGLADGCYGGIRNVVAHEHEPNWTAQVALEYLATLSVLARWIDEAEVEHPS
jgi:uncharacterized protein (TIGR02391 family)